MMKKLGFIFILIVFLFLAIAAVSANDNNTTDIIEQNDSNELKITDTTDIEENNNLSSTETREIISSDDKNTPKKANLKITKNTATVKKGSTYYMYLTDMNGRGIANKQLTIEVNGKDYYKTTGADGKFGIKIELNQNSATLHIKFRGDDGYNEFKQTVKVLIQQVTVTIGNEKLLTNGYLRIYLKGPAGLISYKTLTVTVGGKVFVKKTNAEGFIVIKPEVKAGTYNVAVKYNGIEVSKKIKCIKGDVVNPLKKAVPTVNGIPDIDMMPANFVMCDGDGEYTLTKSQYREVLKRDSYCLFLYNKLSKYTFFKTKASPKVYHILKREKWNVIERVLNTKLVKKNKYNYWPKTVTASLKGKSYTYPEVRDIQNTGYTCGPTSASVCSQALKKYSSEKYFQTKGHVTSGINVEVLKKVLNRNNFKASYFYSITGAVKQLKKGGAALIAFLPNHYVSVIDVSKDGTKILVSNSYGSYDVGCKNVPTNWVSIKYFKSKFAGVGLLVKLNYKLSKNVKKQVGNYYNSMSTDWVRQNVNERIPDIGK